MNDQISPDETAYLVEKRRRLRIVMIAIPALAGALLWLWTNGQSEDFFWQRSLFSKDLYLTVVVTLLGVSGITLVMTYLQTGFKRSAEFEFEAHRLKREVDVAQFNEREALVDMTTALRADIDRARAEIDRALSLAANVGDTDRAALVSDLKAQIRSESAAGILAEMKSDIVASQKRDARDKEILLRFEESRVRLLRELEALGWRGNLNLSLGAVTTVIGLVLLGMGVFSEVTTSKELWGFVTHFAPRLTLVVMIELFAYFFLSLYKASLQEIKYFQNELTNVEAKQIALRAALDFGDQSIVGSMVSALAATERNHVLSKDQTTVELEKAKIERDGRGDIAKYLSEFLQKKN
jgi:hypothetical protein